MSLCFRLDDGQFLARSDLVDAPTCSLARGAPVLGMGLCYDVHNHMLWSVTADWVDQFYNPGHPASHHTLDRYVDHIMVFINTRKICKFSSFCKICMKFKN